MKITLLCYDVCHISGFQDSINRKRIEDDKKTNSISYGVAKFQNLHNMSLIIKQVRLIKLTKYKISKSFLDYASSALWY